MDLHLKQWGNKEHESEHEHSAKMPKLLLEEQTHHHQQPQSSAALPLFVSEPNTNSRVSTLSAFSDSTLPTPRLTSRMGSYFSLAQWQELELQALIFRYMLAGTAVPPELLRLIKRSLILHSSPYFLHHPFQQYYPHYQSVLLQSGYWGRAAVDPEPGRCRRTDGKKWRCSRDVVAGQKYCERHVHRGRNRSRKPVELPTPTVAVGGGRGSLGATTSNSSPPLATSSMKSPFDLLSLNQSSSRTENENNGLFGNKDNIDGDDRSGGHILRPFFSDWPQSVQEPGSNAEGNAGSMNSATCLSISMPGNTSSDVSLKLSSGNEEDICHRNGNVETEQTQLNWAGGWNSSNQVASMGGPLAEALRSSNSTLSPTSVLHQLPRNIASEASFISTYI